MTKNISSMSCSDGPARPERICAPTLGELFDRATMKLPVEFQTETLITSFEEDSRLVKPGSIFVAVAGETVDGHEYIAKVLEMGACMVIAERVPEGINPAGKILLVEDTHHVLGQMAQAYWGNPSKRLQVIGVTGTNGKTTTAYLLDAALRNMRRYPALFSTVEYRMGDQRCDASNTTPGALQLARMMALALERDADTVVMEVSSHALVQGRVEGIHFDVAIMTNLTQDHLDYHHTMNSYAEAKWLLFSKYKPKVAIFNLDDPTCKAFSERYKGRQLTFSLSSETKADLTPGLLEVGASGISIAIRFPENVNQKTNPQANRQVMTLHSPLRGKFNASNLMAAASACVGMGIMPEQVVTALNGMKGAPGRFEALDAGQNFSVYIDYAHTPDAVKNVLENVRIITHGRIIAVLGCGGDRDPIKRPIMGEIMGNLADYAIITSDNPRSENPADIAKEMEDGVLKSSCTDAYEITLDRKQAIQNAIKMARQNDAVVIAGKGHETYQIIGRERNHFDDRETALEILKNRPGA